MPPACLAASTSGHHPLVSSQPGANLNTVARSAHRHPDCGPQLPPAVANTSTNAKATGEAAPRLGGTKYKTGGFVYASKYKSTRRIPKIDALSDGQRAGGSGKSHPQRAVNPGLLTVGASLPGQRSGRPPCHCTGLIAGQSKQKDRRIRSPRVGGLPGAPGPRQEAAIARGWRRQQGRHRAGPIEDDKAVDIQRSA